MILFGATGPRPVPGPMPPPVDGDPAETGLAPSLVRDAGALSIPMSSAPERIESDALVRATGAFGPAISTPPEIRDAASDIAADIALETLIGLIVGPEPAEKVILELANELGLEGATKILASMGVSLDGGLRRTTILSHGRGTGTQSLGRSPRRVPRSVRIHESRHFVDLRSDRDMVFQVSAFLADSEDFEELLIAQFRHVITS